MWFYFSHGGQPFPNLVINSPRQPAASIPINRHEMIIAFRHLRRQGKESYLFNYNNELHGIQGRANQKDWAGRMQTFFDVKLKGAPEPEWMAKGIAAKDKGKDQLAKPVIRP